jgi:hypothetical protein
MKLAALGRFAGGGGAMSVVIRGSGSVCGPVPRCHSASASLSAPRSARVRKIPWQDVQRATSTSISWWARMVPWHWGQVISSMALTLLLVAGYCGL